MVTWTHYKTMETAQHKMVSFGLDQPTKPPCQTSMNFNCYKM